jgi:hypothetical protein
MGKTTSLIGTSIRGRGHTRLWKSIFEDVHRIKVGAARNRGIVSVGPHGEDVDLFPVMLVGLVRARK